MSNLTFLKLSQYNRERVNFFRHGGLEGWNVAEWSNAIAGETGELCNVTKKIIRGDYADYSVLGPEGSLPPTVKQTVADELADIVTYCDLLAQKCNINLGEAVAHKFNIVSKRVNFTHIMEE